jgi:hypothetical protein
MILLPFEGAGLGIEELPTAEKKPAEALRRRPGRSFYSLRFSMQKKAGEIHPLP